MTTVKNLSVEEILNDLLDRTDGPVTEFTAIHRAVEFIKYNPGASSENIAQAMYDAIRIIGEADGRISSNEFNRY